MSACHISVRSGPLKMIFQEVEEQIQQEGAWLKTDIQPKAVVPRVSIKLSDAVSQPNAYRSEACWRSQPPPARRPCLPIEGEPCWWRLMTAMLGLTIASPRAADEPARGGDLGANLHFPCGSPRSQSQWARSILAGGDEANTLQWGRTTKHISRPSADGSPV